MIFSSVKNIVSKYIDKSSKQVYFYQFKALLNKQNIGISIQEILIKEFDSNFNTMFIDSASNNDDIACGIMWITLFNYCESIISSNTMNYKRMVFYGPSGCGKTSFICSLIEKLNLKKVVFSSDNEDSKFHLRNILNDVEIIDYIEGDIYESIELHECNSLRRLNSLMNLNSRIRLFICISSNMCISSLNLFTVQIFSFIKRVVGIIITKLDFYSSLACCFESCHLFNSKILMFSENEIKSVKRKILPSQILSTQLLDSVFDKKMYDMETIKVLFSNNISVIDLHTYYVYIKVLIGFESVNMDTIMDTVCNIAKKMNVSLNLEQMKNLRSMKINTEVFVKLKKHIVILCSMRRCEKKYSWMLDDNRIKRIAFGSGVSIHDVKEMLQDFERYKQSMKYMNFHQFIDKIK